MIQSIFCRSTYFIICLTTLLLHTSCGRFNHEMMSSGSAGSSSHTSNTASPAVHTMKNLTVEDEKDMIEALQKLDDYFGGGGDFYNWVLLGIDAMDKKIPMPSDRDPHTYIHTYITDTVGDFSKSNHALHAFVYYIVRHFRSLFPTDTHKALSSLMTSEQRELLIKNLKEKLENCMKYQSKVISILLKNGARLACDMCITTACVLGKRSSRLGSSLLHQICHFNPEKLGQVLNYAPEYHILTQYTALIMYNILNSLATATDFQDCIKRQDQYRETPFSYCKHPNHVYPTKDGPNPQASYYKVLHNYFLRGEVCNEDSVKNWLPTSPIRGFRKTGSF